MSLHPLYTDKCSFELWLNIDIWLLWPGLDTGHVSCMGQEKSMCRILVGRPEGKRNLEDMVGEWRIVLKWMTVVKWNKRD